MCGANLPEADPRTAAVVRSKRGIVDKRILPAAFLILTLAGGVRAATPAAEGPLDLGGPAVADSLRTNLWLVEAMMGEIAGEAVSALPPAPARVLLTDRPAPGDKAAELMRMVTSRVLADRGYVVLVDHPDSLRGSGPDCTATFSVDQVELTYPDVGRTLGLWRKWVDREVNVVVSAEIADAASGQLLFNDRLARRFSDRVPDGEFPEVNSRLYPFTTAEVGESGWHRRLEEFAVLGTLVGLVAVYFANTGD
jgi:hypothetical protein